MKTLFLVPARAGSKGLPGKNLRLVGGMSLVARAVRTARQCIRRRGIADAVVLVDTDSDEIAAEGRRWGAEAPFLRPASLARDDTPTIENTLHALDRAEKLWGPFNRVVLLQATSPLRLPEDVDRCLDAYDPVASPSIVSIAPAAHSSTLRIVLGRDGIVTWAADGDTSVARRQDHPVSHVLNGAVYLCSVSWLRSHRRFVVSGKTRGVVMPAERSVDIDTLGDLKFANVLAGTSVGALVLGTREIDPKSPCFLIAEAGVNHNGDISLAHRLVDVAADAGADAVKFQTFEPDLLVTRTAPQAEYQRANTGLDEPQHAMLQKLALPRKAFNEIYAHAVDRGLLFLSSPFDTPSVDFLDELGVAAFKIPSGELTNHPFLAHVARKGKPLLISTGMSTLDEVAAALDVVEEHGNPPVALLHCVTSYPTDPADCNLRAIETMTRAFGLPVGWSDHTLGITISCAAVALGARIIEKHFTLDRNFQGPDHRASLEPAELRTLVEAVRAVGSSRGDGLKHPTPAELLVARAARRSLHAARELLSGHVIEPEDLVALRPGCGIPPSRCREIIGRTTLRSIVRGDIITETDLD